MKEIVFFLLAGMLLFFSGCTNKADSIASEEVHIRIQNAGKFEYSDVVVNTGGGVNQYGSIAPAQFSGYKVFDFAYPYAFIELSIDGATYTLQPIDYLGETKLSAGKYTYIINARDTGSQYNKLILTLAKD
jgi:hypothetical protein